MWQTARPARRATLRARTSDTLAHVVPKPGTATRARSQARLQNALSQAKASITSAPDIKIPEPRSTGGKILLETLLEAVRQGRESLMAAADIGIRSVEATTEQQTAAVDSAHVQSAQIIRTRVRGARTAVSHAAQQQASAVTQTAAAEQEKLATWQTQANTRAAGEVGKSQDSIRRVGAEHAAQVRASGAGAAGAATSSLASASTAARSERGTAGGGAASEGHAEVADRIGGDAASQIESASREAGEPFRARAEEAAGVLDAQTSRAAAAIGTETAYLQSEVGQTVSGASGELHDAGGESAGELRDGGQRAQSELNKVQSTVLESLDGRAAEQREEIQTAGAESAIAIGQQTETALRAAQEQLTAHATRIASGHVDDRAAAEAVPELHSQIVNAYTTAAGQARDATGAVSARLSSAGQEAAGAIAQAPSRVTPEISTAARKVQSDMVRATRQAGVAMDRAATSTIAGGEEAVSKAGQQMEQAVSQSRGAFTEAVDSAGRSLDEQAAETERQAKEAVRGVRDRIAEGQGRVDGFVTSKGPLIQLSILGDIGSWFADQFSDLWDMLSSPSFWVGLVVAVVLTPFVGPAAAVVIGGVVGGAVSGIEQNVRQGRSWYDWRNIVRNAVIGGVAGAAIVGGVALIGLAGLEGAAAVAAVMGVSAVVGIAVNLVTGQRWDKGLLANLLLAGLFYRIFGPRGRQPAEEGAPPTTGGRSTERIPGVYEGIDPKKAPQGWTFNDSVTTSGGETRVTTNVTAPDGSTGHVIRGRVNATGEFIMHEAFLDGIPKPLRWVQTDPAAVPGRGTPLEAYLTMRQMRLLEQQGGGPGTFTGPRVVRISSIVNERTILELAAAEKGPPSMPRDQAILGTHSVQYANNSIIQSGGRIASAHVEGGIPGEVRHFNPTPEQLLQYRLSPTDPVIWGFDIILDVVPAGTPAPAPGPRGPVAPPPHVPVPDED